MMMKKILFLLMSAALVSLAPVYGESAGPPEPGAFDLRELGASVLPFSDEKSAQELAAQGPVVYFFAATWCPSCQTIYRDLKRNAGAIPQDLRIIFVNYDKAGELKKKYGVTYQHTFVQIDSKGAKLKIWSGGMLPDVLKKLGLP